MAASSTDPPSTAPPPRGSRAIRRAALGGLCAGLAYGVLESLTADVLSVGFRGMGPRTPLHPLTPLLFTALYAAAGAAVGAFSGALLAANRRRPAPDPAQVGSGAAAAALLMALAANLLAHPESTRSFAFVVSAVAATAAAGLTLPLSARLRDRRPARWLPAPVLLGLGIGYVWLLLGVLTSAYSGRDRALAALALPAALLGSAALARRLSPAALRGPERLGRRALLGAGLAVAVAGLAAFLRAPAAPIDVPPVAAAPTRTMPNVVMVVLDTTRADHLSVFGYGRRTTPNLEELAKHATVYPRAISAADMTLASHATLFTGLYPISHRAHYAPGEFPYGRPLPDENHTLAEILSANGYRTIGVTANHVYLGRYFRLQQGFQYWDDEQGYHWLPATAGIALRAGITELLRDVVPRKAWMKRYRNADEINRAVFARLDRGDRDGRPLFLFVNFMDAHRPYLPPPPYDTMFPGRRDEFDDDWYGNELLPEVMSEERAITLKETEHLVSQYDGAIAYLDSRLADFFAGLAARGLDQNTLVIVVSDHGEAFGRRHLLSHAVSVYDDQVRVPLIIRAPGQTEGRVVEAPVSNVDVAPTVLQLLGLGQMEGFAGRSLFAGLPARGRPLLSESYPSPMWPERLNRTQRALVEWPFKLVESDRGQRELYDIAKDPNETRNLASERPDEVRRLESALQRELARSEPTPRPGAPRSRDPLDAETIRGLRALGYVQ